MLTQASYHTLIYTHMTEKEWQQQVVDAAHTFGYIVYHTYDSRRCEKGYPDLTLLRTYPHVPRMVMLELKTEKGRLTRSQTQWIGGLLDAGIEVYVLRPSQFNELVEILKR